ncbi:hypothetical protein HHI36_009375, partial [Cryptolaemus montrouzieri]
YELSKKLWSIIKNLENEEHLQANDIRELESEDGIVTTCRKQISTILNNHFVTVGANLAKKINSHNPGRLEEKSDESPPSAMMYLRPTTSKEVVKIINKLKTNAAAGYDKVKPKLVKEIKNIIAPIIARLVNSHFREEVFRMS